MSVSRFLWDSTGIRPEPTRSLLLYHKIRLMETPGFAAAFARLCRQSPGVGSWRGRAAFRAAARLPRHERST